MAAKRRCVTKKTCKCKRRKGLAGRLGMRKCKCKTKRVCYKRRAKTSASAESRQLSLPLMNPRKRRGKARRRARSNPRRDKHGHFLPRAARSNPRRKRVKSRRGHKRARGNPFALPNPFAGMGALPNPFANPKRDRRGVWHRNSGEYAKCRKSAKHCRRFGSSRRRARR